MKDKEFKAYCPYEFDSVKKCTDCQKNKISFKFIGNQKTREVPIKLYNCPIGFTFAEKTIEAYNQKRNSK